MVGCIICRTRHCIQKTIIRLWIQIRLWVTLRISLRREITNTTGALLIYLSTTQSSVFRVSPLIKANLLQLLKIKKASRSSLKPHQSKSSLRFRRTLSAQIQKSVSKKNPRKAINNQPTRLLSKSMSRQWTKFVRSKRRLTFRRLRRENACAKAKTKSRFWWQSSTKTSSGRTARVLRSERWLGWHSTKCPSGIGTNAKSAAFPLSGSRRSDS